MIIGIQPVSGRDFTLENLTKFYIDGAWVSPASNRELPVLNPATENTIGTIYLADESDVDRAVSAAKNAFDSFSQTTQKQRLALLENLLVATEARIEDLAQAICQEMGAPITMARTVQAVAGIGHLQGFIDALKELKERQTLKSGHVLLREPIGICGLITPWNWPINQIALKVIPALATGCTCVLKPSEHTPISAMVYAEIIHEAGYPPGVFNLIQGDGAVAGSAMSRHEDIQMMSFTGSTRAGQAISKEAAANVKRVTLELGGKSPNLVFADCNLSDRVAASVLECMFNTGQSCDAPTRLLVEASCYEQVLEIAKATAENLDVGNPAQEGDHMGPLFDQIQYDRVQAMIKVGIAEGATLLTGGLGKAGEFEKGWFAKPTIFFNVNNGMRIAQEEIFGPVLVIIPFEDEEEAVQIANDTPYGLAAYIQTGNSARALRVANRLRAGAVHINGGRFSYGLPFGGYKQSGNGREGGRYGLEDYQELKTLHMG